MNYIQSVQSMHSVFNTSNMRGSSFANGAQLMLNALNTLITKHLYLFFHCILDATLLELTSGATMAGGRRKTERNKSKGVGVGKRAKSTEPTHEKSATNYGPRLVGLDELNCFVSHKCDPYHHTVIAQLRAALQRVNVGIFQDPFDFGHDISIRIQTIKFDSFVFLYSPESWASPVCQHELAIARERLVPILTIKLSGTVPDQLKDRLYKTISPEGLLDLELQELANVISVRAELFRTIEQLKLPAYCDNAAAAAKALFDNYDSALIAESVEHIASLYEPRSDPRTRFWLALVIGKAGTRGARKRLEGFCWEDHPYPREGVRQAIEMLSSLKGEKERI